MTWREKSVTVDADSEFIFKSVLGDVKIDLSGIKRDELTRGDEWKKIKSTMDPNEILEGFLPWDRVTEISTKEDFLSYPHIDIEVEKEDAPGTKRLMIFFKKDTPEGFDEVQDCFKTIRKMWNAYRQRNKLHSLNYSFQDNTHRLTPEETGEEQEGDEATSDKEEREEDEEQRQQDDGDSDGGIGDIIDKALSSPGDLMDRFGS
ncbi:MAG: hypothetical protein SV186_06775 [Candidatus Nanohaloarchaea archaeon]|nr:hypothetical protein [Candidatus Nanohaloarchaea archaeon]